MPEGVSISAIISGITDWLTTWAKQQLTYLRQYNINFEKLNNELIKLKDERSSIQGKVDEAQNNRETIKDSVKNWLERVRKIIDEADKLIKDEESADKGCVRGCPNLIVRCQLSEKAAIIVKPIIELWQEALRYQQDVSYQTIPEDIRLTSTKNYEAFESRMHILKEILGTLKKPHFNIIGIYGMGGIGKTTIAKEVARQAERLKLFDGAVFAEVSYKPDIKKIQKEIADQLGLKFHEKSESGRANSLCDRMKKEKKILVILDDIWTKLDLDSVGIPLGDDQRECKLLLTSRSENVLSCEMDSQQNFAVGLLNRKEAWNLFKKKAGDYVEDCEYKSMATKVAEECAGLPVAIVTVASASRTKKSIDYWEDVLQKLRTPSATNFKNIQPKAYTAIKLSFDKLEDEELQKIFLLIAYTYVTSFNELVMYGMGLNLFQGIRRMEQAQRRVRAMVLELKASCMLLDGKWDEDFSIHDVVRDVAISVACTDHHVFMVSNELVDSQKWQEKHYTSIVLHDVKMISELLEVLDSPQLELFCARATDCSLKIPEDCFARLIELKVLHLTQKDSSSQLPPSPQLSSSLRLLTNLQTLRLDGCELEDMAVIGDLKKLEILCFQQYRVVQLPLEVSRLTQLKSLDLRSCYGLNVIPPNVISSLSHLEELYIGPSFTEWEVDGLINTERRNASLDELMYLPNLTCLEIIIKDAKTLPRDLFFKKLVRYKIGIGNWWYWDWNTSPEISRRFKLELVDTNICLNEGHIMQLQGIQDLCLVGSQDLKNVLYGLNDEGFPQLKHIKVQCNPNLQCLIDSSERSTLGAFPLLESLHLNDLVNLDKICHGQFPAESFRKSKIIKVKRCNKLRTIFPFFIARGLSQLEEIEVSECQNMEVIFDMVGEEESNNNSAVTENIELSQLCSLKLNSLPQLTSFCSKLKSPSSTAVMQSNELVLENDTDVSNTLSKEKLRSGFNAFLFPSLKQLEIIGCPKLTSRDLQYVNKRVLPNLEKLKIEENGVLTMLKFSEDLLCKLKRLEVELDESSAISSLDFLIHKYHYMRELQVYGSNLQSPCEDIESTMTVAITEVDSSSMLKHILQQEFNMDNWINLEVCWCPSVINLVPPSTSFRNLTTLIIWGCDGLKNIVTSSTAKSLVQLRKISIVFCEMISEIVADDEGQVAKDEIVFNKLEEIMITDLDCITSFCSNNYSLKFPSLELVIVDECPNMKIFCNGELSTPKLHEVKQHRACAAGWWKEDLNSTIKHMHEERMEEDEEDPEDEQESEDGEHKFLDEEESED